MKNGLVECPSCKDSVSPRLWHTDEGGLVFERATDHICPICGVTMYSSGGGISDLAKFIGTIILCTFIFTATPFPDLLTSFFKAVGFSKGTAELIALIGGVFITFKLYLKAKGFLFPSKTASKKI